MHVYIFNRKCFAYKRQESASTQCEITELINDGIHFDLKKLAKSSSFSHHSSRYFIKTGFKKILLFSDASQCHQHMN